MIQNHTLAIQHLRKAWALLYIVQELTVRHLAGSVNMRVTGLELKEFGTHIYRCIYPYIFLYMYIYTYIYIYIFRVYGTGIQDLPDLFGL